MYVQKTRGCPKIKTLALVPVLIMLITAIYAEPQLRYPTPTPLVSSGFSYQNQSERAFSEFVPIGWSREGKFAFVKQSNIGGECGDCPFFVVTIQDLVTDEIIWTWQSDIMSESSDSLLDQVWVDNAEVIQNELSLCAIEPIDDSTGVVYGIGNRLTALGREYSYDVHTETRTVKIPNPYDGGSTEREIVENAEIRIGASGLGGKRIFRSSFEIKDRIVALGVAGSVTSDFSPRAAVIVVKTVLDFEHTRVFDWHIVGAHLTYNFR